MTTLIDNTSGEWVSNEVYEIQQTDRVEGAAAGASFGGIGISNQPHQQLANRTAFLYQRQSTNIANITALQGELSRLGARNTWANWSVFASPGSYGWIAPGGVSVVRAIVAGGGGGGSNCGATSLGGNASGGGGGAGGYAEGFVSVSPGSAYSVVVGAGGGSEAAGGTSSFGPLVAVGGSAAFFFAPATGPGGGGGEASGGFVGLSGGVGSDGQADSFVFAGNGAAGPWGGGGRAGNHGGLPGAAPGAGGGGAYDSELTGNTYYGAPGAAGIVIIIW